MSVDRVIVGGGHFVERGGQLVQELVEKGPNLMNAFERAQERLAFDRNIEIAPRVFTFHEVLQQQNSDRLPIILCEANEGNDNNWVDRNDRQQDAADQLERSLEAMKEGLLAWGCAAAGDLEGAVDHGAQAAEKTWENFVDKFNSIFGSD